MAGIIALFVLGYFYPAAGVLAKLLLLASFVLFVADAVMLFRPNQALQASRKTPKRFSNGDSNTISVELYQHYPFATTITLIDELPFQFQRRDHQIKLSLEAGGQRVVSYDLRPTERGEYAFGALNVYASSPLSLIERRFRFDEEQMVPVYPSYVQMQQYELQAISDQLTDVGIKKIRRRGHTMEFDQIREYVQGDDVRSINWKATARAGDLMVNQYQDERSQRVYNIIDTGRVMKMPFDGLSLLDHAINTSLAISNIVLRKDDKAGLVTFNDREYRFVKAQKKRTHLYKLQEALYNVDTNFKESDFRRLLIFLNTQLKQRSLIFFYTNFESLSALKRKLPVLQSLGSSHLLVTIFFVNTELKKLLTERPQDEEGIYIKAMAEKFSHEKRSMVKMLRQYGIQPILTPPADLSVNTINKYLELKASGMV